MIPRSDIASIGPSGTGSSESGQSLQVEASRALERLLGRPCVSMKLDGAPMLAVFEPDSFEHARRAAAGVGAITSTALLHGLWLLPSGVRVPVITVPDRKVDHLRSAPHMAGETEAGFERLYSPAGVVHAVAFASRDAHGALERAIRFTPVFRRFVVAPNAGMLPREAESLAREWCIGLLELQSARARLHLAAGTAVVGVPTVYRWWIAELAYRQWLKREPSL
jgi:hypothetical protein